MCVNLEGTLSLNEIIPPKSVSNILSTEDLNQHQILMKSWHSMMIFYLLQLNTNHWQTWVWATRIKVCVSTALAWRWTLGYTLCGGRRKGKGRERDGEKRVWPAKWLSRSPSLLSDKSNANWQSALWLQIHWLPPPHRWSLSHTHTHTHTHTTQQHTRPTRAHTCAHIDKTYAAVQPQWVIALCIKQVNLCRKNNTIWVWQTFLITHSESIFNRKTATQITLSFFFFPIIKILWI